MTEWKQTVWILKYHNEDQALASYNGYWALTSDLGVALKLSSESAAMVAIEAFRQEFKRAKDGTLENWWFRAAGGLLYPQAVTQSIREQD